MAQWLSKGPDGEPKTTANFSLSSTFETHEAAQAAWADFVALPESQANKARWISEAPVIFTCPDQKSPPSSLTLYIAMCQGRFVAERDSVGGSESYLHPELAKAQVFTSIERALGAIARVMPAKSNKPAASVLPLLATFGAPIQASDHGQDPLACAMVAESLRSAIEQSSPAPAPSSKTKPRSL